MLGTKLESRQGLKIARSGDPVYPLLEVEIGCSLTRAGPADIYPFGGITGPPTPLDSQLLRLGECKANAAAG